MVLFRHGPILSGPFLGLSQGTLKFVYPLMFPFLSLVKFFFFSTGFYSYLRGFYDVVFLRSFFPLSVAGFPVKQSLLPVAFLGGSTLEGRDDSFSLRRTIIRFFFGFFSWLAPTVSRGCVKGPFFSYFFFSCGPSQTLFPPELFLEDSAF